MCIVACSKLPCTFTASNKRKHQGKDKPHTSKRPKTASKLNQYGYTSLHLEVICKNVSGVASILDKARENKEVQLLINQRDCFGYPALHYLVLDALEPYSEKHLTIHELFLGSDIYDINAKDPDHFFVLYWFIKYKQPKLAKTLLESEQLETFTEFISKKLNEYYNSEPLTDSARLFYLRRLTCAVREILNLFVLFLTDADQADPDIVHTKKLLMEKYFGVCAQPIKTEIDILNLLLNSVIFDEQSDSILVLKPGKCDEPSDLISTLKSGEVDKTTNLILASGDFDQDIDLDLNNGALRRALKDFIINIKEDIESGIIIANTR